MSHPGTMKWPVVVMFAAGAALTQVFLIGDTALPKKQPLNGAAPDDDCAPARPGRLQGQKELLVGQKPQLKPGVLNSIIERAENNTVILSFASSEYKGSLMNWLARLSELSVSNYAIVCLDEPLMMWLTERRSRCQYMLQDWKHGVWTESVDTTCANAKRATDSTLQTCKYGCVVDADCRAVSWKSGSSVCSRCRVADYSTSSAKGTDLYLKMTTDTLWWARWKLLVRLLNQDINVLMSDLDAMFLQNPLPVLHSLTGGADIIAQRGSFPDIQGKKWGSALCMGFSFWRSSPDTKRFVAPMTAVIESSGDDQVGLNVALDKQNVDWDTPVLPFERAVRVNYGKTRLGLRVALLPHNRFPRNCQVMSESDVAENSIVAHCFASAKSGDAKAKMAQKYKLWILRDDWESAVDPSSVNTFEEYLKLIQHVSMSTQQYGVL